MTVLLAVAALVAPQPAVCQSRACERRVARREHRRRWRGRPWQHRYHHLPDAEASRWKPSPFQPSMDLRIFEAAGLPTSGRGALT